MVEQRTGEVSFIVRLYGEKAQEDALTIRQKIESTLAQTEGRLTAKINHTNRAITSQTRRLTNNIKRIAQAANAAESLAKAWMVATKAINQEGGDTFDELVKSAQEAYDKLVGHSILTRLEQVMYEIYGRIERRGADVFEPLAEGAELAAREVVNDIQGVYDSMGKLRFPAGAELEGHQIGGKWTTPEKLEQYRHGLLGIQDVMPQVATASDDITDGMDRQGRAVDTASGVWDGFTERLNAATLKFFGLRRLGYGLEQAGSQLAAAGEKNMQTLAGWAKMYGEFNEYATRAAAAMEMTAEQQRMLEETVLANIDAMRLFTPEEIVDGLRAWAAGTGAVVKTQEELNAIMEQTDAVQILAALGGAQLEDTMRNVGGTMAEYGLALQDVERITAVYNFTAAKTFAEVEDMGDAFRLVGPLAASLSISLEETAAALGMLADQNIKGTMAGRAFRQMLIQLVKPTKDHNDAMNRALGLTGKLGDTWQDIVFPQGEFIGLAKYIDVLAASTENLTEQQRNNQLATIATANELPTLIALVNAQIDARKEGINIMRAWTKWSVGIVDDEVVALQDYMERVRGVQMDVSTNMYNLWDTQSTLFYESESAKIMRFEQQWRTMQIKLGELVLGEGTKNVETMLDLMEKVAKFVEDHPQLVQGAIIAAGIELVLGSLISIVGQMLGMVANILILHGAFKGFSISVAGFQTAVAAFTRAVGAKAATDTGVGSVGWLALAFRAFSALGLAHIAVSGESKRLERGRELFAELDVFFETEEILWLQELAKEGVELRMGPEWMGGIRNIRDTFGGEMPYDWAIVLQDMLNQGVISLERYKELFEELVALGGESPVLGVDAEIDLPPELQHLLDELGVTLDIYPVVVGGVTEEQEEAIKLYDSMNEKLANLTEKHLERSQELVERYAERELQYKEDYLERREDIIEDYQDRETSYLQKHLDKLAALQDTYEQRIADAVEDLNEKLEAIWEKAARKEADIKADTQRRIEKERESHLKKLQRMQEDHQTSLWDLAVKRDAYGIFREMRDYKTKRSREMEDHRDRIKDIGEADALKLAEARETAAREEADARKSHAKKLADTDKWLADQLKKEKDSYKEAARERAKANKKTLDDLDTQYKKQRRRRQDAHFQELQDLREKFDDEREEIQTSMTLELAELLGYYAQGAADYQQYLQDRLTMLQWYLDTNRQLWEEAQAPPPIVPPATPDTPGWMGGPVESFLDPVPSRTVVVKGDFAMNITADRNAAEVGVPAAALEVEMTKVFDQVTRQLEVAYV